MSLASALRRNAQAIGTIGTIGTAVACVVAGPIIGAGTAHAADTESDQSDQITFSVQPVRQDDEPRSWIEQSLDPGDTASDEFLVRNLSSQDLTFQIGAADGLMMDDGRYTILNDGEASTDAGTWIDVQEQVSVEAGETVTVPFTTIVPADAESGDHAAGIVASVVTPGTDSDGVQVAVQSRMGFRVMTRVSGELDPELSASADASFDVNWVPWRPGQIQVTTHLTNSGNERIKVGGTVTIGGTTTPLTSDDAAAELLPGDTRDIATTVSGIWPLIRAHGSVTLDAQAVTFDGTESALSVPDAEFSVWTIPVPQALVLLALGLVVAADFTRRRRSRRRLAAQIAAAREAGRQEALDGGAETEA
jgi:hypothetical protein